MALYAQMNRSQLTSMLEELRATYREYAGKGLKLDLSRGKPDSAQLDLSMGLLDSLVGSDSPFCETGFDCRNYGLPEGIPEARRLMAQLMDVEPQNIMIGGNASLNLMHDCMAIAYVHGLPGSQKSWGKLDNVKFLCPSPGYDRHFAVSEHFGFELVTVPMTPDGPDMDVVEQLATQDESIKGMWCVPKYSNPQGLTYSDDTIRRMAGMKPAAKDFCIFYDNAYMVHDLYPDDPDVLLPIMPQLTKAGNENMIIQFASTSKISFPGSGIAALAASSEMLTHLMKHFALQTIGFDKMNQLRQVRYFKDIEVVKAHMRKQAALLLPKFTAVLDALETQLGNSGIAVWGQPKGGYFISLDVMEGCAKRIVALCKEAGVVMTPAGATYPYGNDPADSNIRIAPTFATVDEVNQAAELLCLCVRMASVERLLDTFSADAI